MKRHGDSEPGDPEEQLPRPHPHVHSPPRRVSKRPQSPLEGSDEDKRGRDGRQHSTNPNFPRSWSSRPCRTRSTTTRRAASTPQSSTRRKSRPWTSQCQFEIILDIQPQPSTSDNKSGPHGLSNIWKGLASYLHANMAFAIDCLAELELKAAEVNLNVPI